MSNNFRRLAVKNSKMARKLLSNRGFTLVEVLIAVGIFVLFSGSIIGLFSQSSKINVVNKHRLEAANLAREGIEEVTQVVETARLNKVTWDTLANGTSCANLANGEKILSYETGCFNGSWRVSNGTGQSFYLKENEGTVSETEPAQPYIKYDRKITISDAGTGIKRVQVIVSWTDYDKTYSAEENTYFSRWQL